jgi:hypothetical protein
MIQLDSDLPSTPSVLFRCIDDTPVSPASRAVLTKPIASPAFEPVHVELVSDTSLICWSQHQTQIPSWQDPPSSHGVPLITGSFKQPEIGWQESSVHSLSSSHERGSPTQ